LEENRQFSLAAHGQRLSEVLRGVDQHVLALADGADVLGPAAQWRQVLPADGRAGGFRGVFVLTGQGSFIAGGVRLAGADLAVGVQGVRRMLAAQLRPTAAGAPLGLATLEGVYVGGLVPAVVLDAAQVIVEELERDVR